MINVQLKNREDAFCVVLSQRWVTVGPNQTRHVVEADVYQRNNDTDQLAWVNKGMSMLNPLDRFDARLGALKAVSNAFQFSPREVRQQVADIVDAWF